MLLLAASGPWPARAADDAASADLQRKSAEVENLKRDLERKQRELEQLRKENDRLRRERKARPANLPTAPARPATPALPVTPIDTLPPLARTDVVELHDLVGHFAAKPEAADARYAKKAFRIKGEISRFDSKLVIRNYEVLLEAPDNPTLVICTFNYVDRYATVFTKQHGEVLVARTTGGTEVPLHRLGDTVIIQGTCKGLKNGEIVFTGCQVVK
jgi:hypothetical protein